MSTSVLFVCLGNICRSPVAEGICRDILKTRKIEHISCDSAGTAAWHIGKSPDSRSQRSCRLHGVDISDLKARQVKVEDFYHFDLILALDESNYQDLMALCPAGHEHKVSLLLSYTDSHLCSVPDPYYGGEDGFETVYLLVHQAVSNLIDELVSNVAG